MHPPELAGILSRTHELAKGVVAAEAEAVDREGRWPEKCLRALQAADLGGLMAPKTSGGLGQGLFALVQVCEVIGEVCASTAICFGMHCVGTAVIAAKATLDQQQRYLEPISQGRHLTTLALSEPGTGAHFYFPQTKLEAVSPETFRVAGTKSFVTNGPCADSYVVSTATAHPNAAPGQFSCVMIPNTAAVLPRETPVVLGDAEQLQQALLQLCANARDALEQVERPAYRLAISAEVRWAKAREKSASTADLPERYVCLRVADNGSGMDAQTQQRIFEPFFTTKEVGSGTGLGLSMVYGIVLDHGGWIECDSQVGAGTTFSIYLPAGEGLP